MKYSNKKRKEKLDAFPCKTCITYVICLHERNQDVTMCPILKEWWLHYKYPERRCYIYDKFFPPKPRTVDHSQYNYE